MNASTGRMNVMRYRERDRNQLVNCMLLTAQENGAGGKHDTPPGEWFVGEREQDSYLKMHLIPRDPALWKLERFDDFIAARKKLIAENFKPLLVSPDRRIPIDVTPRVVQPFPDRQKMMSKLIDAGLISEQCPLVLTYRGHEFSGKARREGIELADGGTYSPSAAAIRCYADSGSPRTSENGWAVWKSQEGKSLNDLFEQLQPVPTLDDL
jgi:hypothetical protein